MSNTSSSSTTIAASSGESVPSAHLPTGGSPPPASSPPMQQPPVMAVTDGALVDVTGDSGGASNDEVGNFPDDMNEVRGLIIELRDNARRAHALSELAQRRAMYQQMAPLIWFSLGAIGILLQEVMAAYPFVSPPPRLTLQRLRRACDALSLLQCIASHPEIKSSFAQARIPHFLFKFIKATSRAWMYQHLRLAALGVIHALMKPRDEAVIGHLLSSGVMPLCLYAMGSGCELSRSISLSTFEKLLMDDSGLSYVCLAPAHLLFANRALRNELLYLTQHPSPHLLTLVIKCYLRLTFNEMGRRSVKLLLPRQLTDGSFNSHLVGAPRAHAMLFLLRQIISFPAD